MILVVNESMVFGGAEKVLVNILSQPNFRSHNILAVLNVYNPTKLPSYVRTISLHSPFEYSPRSTTNPFTYLKTTFLKLTAYLTTLFYTALLVFRQKPESIYVHSGGFPSGFLNTSFFLSALLLSLLSSGNCKFTIAIHSVPLQNNLWLYPDWLLLWLISRSTPSFNIIFVSHFSCNAFLEIFPFHVFKNHCSVIYNKLNTFHLHSAYQSISTSPDASALDLIFSSKPSSSIDLAIVGYIDSVKDQPSAVRFFLTHYSLYSCFGISINLHIYGSDKCINTYSILTNLATDAMSLRYFNIIFHGNVQTSEIPYHSFHYLLSFSSIESYPLSLIESISFGTPCICNTVGGVPEIISNDVNGILFDKNKLDTASATELMNTILLPIRASSSYRSLCWQTYLSGKKAIIHNQSLQFLYPHLICP